MKHLWLKLLSVAAATDLLASARGLSANVVTYPVPVCYALSDQVSITANDANVPVIAYTPIYDYCNFSSGGQITVIITASEPITSYKISPLAFHISGRVSGNTLTFTLDRERYLIVKINKLRELVIADDSLETDAPASSGVGIYNVKTLPYNADSTGKQYATSPIQHAINDATAAGGGIVYVPAGVYKCGNLILKSNVSIYLEGGSVIRGSGLPADYATFFRKDSLKMDGTWFIYTANGASRVKIYGRGTVDGNGQYMRAAHGYLNHIIVPMMCSYFTMDGITVRDSGLWGTTPTRSEHVTIRNAKLLNEVDVVTEDDALDVQESRDVLVDHVIGISQDDAFSTKTWANTDIARRWMGQPQPLSNVTFNDCLAWSRYGAFKAGNGSGQNQTDVVFRNSYVYLCREAILIEPKFGSATYRNFTFENIDVEDYWPKRFDSSWLALQMKTACQVKNVKISKINVRNIGNGGSIMMGYDAQHRLDGVTFSDISVNGKMGMSNAALNITKTNAYVSNVSFVRSDQSHNRSKAESSNPPVRQILGAETTELAGRSGRLENLNPVGSVVNQIPAEQVSQKK